MHYHCEIIMPKTKDIGEALQTILEPFSEHNYEDENHLGKEKFWDWYVIGGRWAGTKELCKYDPEKMEGFRKALVDAKVTVSGVQCGKQTIEPASQIPLVDKLWNEFFPTETGEMTPCPLFDHANDQYDSDDLLGCDICLVEDIPDDLTCARVIVAGPRYEKEIGANFMVCEDCWNGVNILKTNWDGNVKTALKMCEENFQHYKDEYRKTVSPAPDWICVTIDYHA